MGAPTTSVGNYKGGSPQSLQIAGWAVDNKRQVCEAHSLNHQHFVQNGVLEKMETHPKTYEQYVLLVAKSTQKNCEHPPQKNSA